MFSLLIEGGVCHSCSERKDLLLGVKARTNFKYNLICDSCLLKELSSKSKVKGFIGKAFEEKESEDAYITVAQAIEKYPLTKRCIYKNIKEDDSFPAFKLPHKHYLIDEKQLKVWIEDNKYEESH